MSGLLEFDVYGIPAPQGSKKAFVVKGHAVITEASKRLPAWRDAVVTAARRAVAEASWVTLDGPATVWLSFHLPRPKSVRREYPTVAPDVDKLARAVSDALTIAGVITDDSRIVTLFATKFYGGPGNIGAHVLVREASHLDGGEPA